MSQYENEIFVFGSNLRGVHGAGAALHAAENHGAQLGVGVGRTGLSYALPTKDRTITTLPFSEVEEYVAEFLAYAARCPELLFRVTAVGCGLAGFTAEQMAPLFVGRTTNVLLPQEFLNVLGLTEDEPSFAEGVGR